MPSLLGELELFGPVGPLDEVAQDRTITLGFDPAQVQPRGQQPPAPAAPEAPVLDRLGLSGPVQPLRWQQPELEQTAREYQDRGFGTPLAEALNAPEFWSLSRDAQRMVVAEREPAFAGLSPEAQDMWVAEQERTRRGIWRARHSMPAVQNLDQAIPFVREDWKRKNAEIERMMDEADYLDPEFAERVRAKDRDWNLDPWGAAKNLADHWITAIVGDRPGDPLNNDALSRATSRAFSPLDPTGPVGRFKQNVEKGLAGTAHSSALALAGAVKMLNAMPEGTEWDALAAEADALYGREALAYLALPVEQRVNAPQPKNTRWIYETAGMLDKSASMLAQRAGYESRKDLLNRLGARFVEWGHAAAEHGAGAAPPNENLADNVVQGVVSAYGLGKGPIRLLAAGGRNPAALGTLFALERYGQSEDPREALRGMVEGIVFERVAGAAGGWGARRAALMEANPALTSTQAAVRGALVQDAVAGGSFVAADAIVRAIYKDPAASLEEMAVQFGVGVGLGRLHTELSPALARERRITQELETAQARRNEEAAIALLDPKMRQEYREILEEVERAQPAQEPAAPEAVQAPPSVQIATHETPEPNQAPTPTAQPARGRFVYPDGREVQGVVGRDTKILLQNQESSQAYYALVEARDLLTSHDPLNGFAKTKGYPEYAQEKDYATEENLRGLVLRDAQSFKPELIWTNDPTPISGPTIITPDGIARGGNRRGMIQKLVASTPEGAERMRQYAIEHAAELGLDPARAAEMTAPVPVRVMLDRNPATPQEALALSALLNRTVTGQTGGARAGVSRAASLTEPTMRALEEAIGDIESKDVLGALKKSKQLVEVLDREGIIAIEERGTMIDKGGTLTDQGLGMVKDLIVGRLVRDPAVAQRLNEATRNRLLKMSPSILRSDVATEGYLSRAIAEAALAESDRSTRGITISEYLAQPEFGGNRVYTDPGLVRVMELLAPNNFGGTTEPTAVKAFQQFAERVTDMMQGQVDMLRGPDSIERIWRDTLGGTFGGTKAEVPLPEDLAGVAAPNADPALQSVSPKTAYEAAPLARREALRDTLSRALEALPTGDARAGTLMQRVNEISAELARSARRIGRENLPRVREQAKAIRNLVEPEAALEQAKADEPALRGFNGQGWTTEPGAVPSEYQARAQRLELATDRYAEGADRIARGELEGLELVLGAEPARLVREGKVLAGLWRAARDLGIPDDAFLAERGARLHRLTRGVEALREGAKKLSRGDTMGARLAASDAEVALASAYAGAERMYGPAVAKALRSERLRERDVSEAMEREVESATEALNAKPGTGVPAANNPPSYRGRAATDLTSQSAPRAKQPSLLRQRLAAWRGQRARNVLVRQKIIETFLDELGMSGEAMVRIPVYTGKPLPKRGPTLGQAYRLTWEVRIRDHGDLETTAHEIAHIINYWDKSLGEKLYNGIAYQAARNELWGLSYVTANRAKSNLHVLMEGWAEFVRAWMTVPGWTEANAPVMSRFMAEWLRTSPAAPAMLRARESMQAWYKQDALDRMLSKTEPTPDLSLVKARRADRWRQSVFDQAHGFSLLERTLSGVQGEGGIYESARNLASQSVVEAVLHYGAPVEIATKDPVTGRISTRLDFKEGTKGLYQILEPVRNELEDFGLYLIARRILGAKLLQKGKESLMTPEEVTEVWTRFGDNPRFKKAAEEWDLFNDAVLDYAADSGLIKSSKADALKGQFYVPFFRMQPGSSSGFERQSGNLATFKGLRRLTGGSANLLPIVENMVNNTAMWVQASRVNRLALRVADIAAPPFHDAVKFNPNTGNLTTKDGYYNRGGKFLRELGLETKKGMAPASQIKKQIERALRDSAGPDADPLVEELVKTRLEQAFEEIGGLMPFFVGTAPTGERILQVMRGGEPKYYEVADELLWDSLRAVMTPRQSILPSFLNTARRWGQASVTYSPDFMVANLFRDSIAASVFSRYGYNATSDALRAFRSIVREDETYRLYMLNGGGMSTYAQNAAHVESRIVKFAQSRGVKDVVVKTSDLLRAGLDATESLPRLSEFRKTLEATGSGEHAAYLASEVTVDFKMRGTSEFVNGMFDSILFLKATANGLDRAYRGYTSDPHRGRIGLTTGLFAMSAAAYYATYLRGNPLYEQREEWEKRAYFMIPVPRGDQDAYAAAVHDYYYGTPDQQARAMRYLEENSTLLRVPKPHEIGAVASMAELMMEATLDRLDLPNVAFGGEGVPGNKRNDARRVTGRALAMMRRQFMLDSGVMGLAPHAIQPLLEVAANTDSFTGRPITSLEQEQLPPFLRSSPYGTATVERVMRRLNQSVPVSSQPISPVVIDHLMRSYFNYWALYGTMAADAAIVGDRRPDLKWTESPGVRVFFARVPTPHSKFTSEMYDAIDTAGEIGAGVKHLGERAYADDAQAFLELNRDQALPPRTQQAVLAAAGRVNDALAAVSEAPDLEATRSIALQAQRAKLFEGTDLADIAGVEAWGDMGKLKALLRDELIRRRNAMSRAFVIEAQKEGIE